MKQKILVVELWGIGDLTLATSMLSELLDAGHEVHLLAKDYARPLLEPSYPSLRFLSWEAPWTKFRWKSTFWRHPWIEFASLTRRLRAEHYDAAVSARNDCWDFFLIWLAGAAERYGFAVKGSRFFLTHPVNRTHGENQHKVEDWRDLGTALGLPGMQKASPHLNHHTYPSARIDALLASVPKPILTLHAGAHAAIRRWPESYFAEIIHRLRQEFDFHLVLIPDRDGYGLELTPLVNTVIDGLTLPELVNMLARSDLVLCNDSGPAHMTAACERPTITIFGPGGPKRFRPWGDIQKIVIRDLCSLRPCYDNCPSPEPYCMTRLLPQEIWPEVHKQILNLVEQRVLPSNFINATTIGQ